MRIFYASADLPVDFHFLAVVAILFSFLNPAFSAPESEFQVISTAVSPEVAYSVSFDAAKKSLKFRISVEAMRADWPRPEVNVGVSAHKKLVLGMGEAKTITSGLFTIYEFTVDAVKLDPQDTELKKFRWGFDVGWFNSEKQLVQRETFLVNPSRPTYLGVGTDPLQWNPFSLQENERLVKNLARQIRISWDQPVEGKATVVIDAKDGKRVRNLISGRSYTAGKHAVTWDGLDEQGILIAPGSYTWRVVTHPGIIPNFLMSYYNPGKPGWKDGPTSMWMGDHSAPTCAASNGSMIALGCPVAESGNNIVIVDLQGNKVNEGNLSSFIGSGNLFLAMDDTRFYAFSEGVPYYENIRRDETGKEYMYGSLSLVAWDLKDGNQFRYQGTGKNGDKIVREYRLEPQPKYKRPEVRNLRGVAYLKPSIYVSLHDENKILILDPETGETKGEMAVDKPGAITSDGKRLAVYSGSSLMLFETPGPGATGRVLFAPKLSAPRPLEEADSSASALALSPEGLLYAADDGVDQNVKVYDLSGKLIRQIGKVGGGVPEGKWNRDSMRLPLGLALDGKGQLWVAENHSTPKRISVWNGASGQLVQELFGPAHYGASGAGFDTADTTQWLGGGSLWNIDLQTRKVDMESVLFSGDKKGMPSLKFHPFSAWFLHKDGRTFIISKDSVMRLYELMPGGRAKLWAMLGTLHSYEAESPRWWVPEIFFQVPEIKAVLPDFTEVVGPYGNFRNGPASSKDGRELSVLWVDTNGDDVAQVEEVQVAGDAGHQMRSPAWGYHYENTLDWKLLVGLADGKTGQTELKFNGWLPSGAPDWKLKEAFDQARLIIDFKSQNVQAIAEDRSGRFLLNGSPLTGLSPDGQVQWTYPNRWIGVHGSHDAPLPETGVMQGSLSFLGVAPLDKEGDVTIINGNHGRFFVMTTDGVYLDEMFQDVRISRDANAYRIGGECFGGYFGRDEKTGRYLLQSGHSDYRIFEINGLDKVQRFKGILTVTPEQVNAAQKIVENVVAKGSLAKSVVIKTLEAGEPEPETLVEWGDPGKPFPYAKVKAYRQGTDLVLVYEVKDPSPWVNQGVDRQLLFKTGDVALFEFSTNTDSSDKRSEAAQGDKRLIIAPFQQAPVAVLYDYKVPGTARPVPFNSSWRTALVDKVTVLEKAKIEVKKAASSYLLTARIPLADLGLPAVGKKMSLKGDFGLIYGDNEGRMNILRSYWSNQNTGLVNDVPGETMLNPALWGKLEWK